MKPDCAALLVASEDPCNCGEKKTVDVRGVVQPNPLRIRANHTFWEGHRDDVLKGLGERWTGFHPEFYATKDTYKEDAMRCYNLHRRPKGTDCIDYRDDNRKLTGKHWPDDRAVYFCDFCPVSSQVTTAIRAAAGMYKK
jgi:hypothetical protein